MWRSYRALGQRVRKQYDALIVGTAIGGLISGALLARRGLQVLVVNQEQMPWTFDLQGFRVQREPLWGQGFKRYLFETIFEELEMTSEERLLFERSQPVFQVVLPRHRLDLSAQREALMDEYRREFPTAIDAIERFYAALDAQERQIEGKISNRDLKKPLAGRRFVNFLYPNRSNVPLKTLFEQFSLPLEFELAITAQISFLSHLHTANPTLAQAALVLGQSQRKDYYFSGEGDELAQIFYERIRRQGGEIRDDAFVEKLLVSGRAIRGARLSSYEGVVEAKTVLGNMDIHRVFDLLDTPKVPRRLHHRLEKIQPRFVKCSLFLAVHETVLPVGMQNNVVLLRDELKPLLDDNLVFVHVLPNRTGSNHRVLHISFLLSDTTSLSALALEARFNDISRRVLEHVSWMIPFLRQHTVMTTTDFLRRFSLYRTVYDGLEERTRGGGFENRTHLKNLFVTGPEIFPALGLEGETISSLNAANLAFASTRGRTALFA